MIRPICASILLLTAALEAQEANRITFTLVSEGNYNKLAVSASVPLLGGSDDVSILSGTIEAILNIDETTHQTDTLTFLEGDLSGTDIELSSSSFFFGSYDIASKNLEAGVVTPLPPGVVTPANGEFEASQHNFIVRKGTLEGMASGEDVFFDFSDTPFVGTGSGTGTVVVTPGTKSVDRQYYEVSFVIPVEIEDSIDTGVLNIMAEVTMDAELKAVGTTFVARADYASWAADNTGTDAGAADFTLNPTMPNGLIYSLGFDAATVPTLPFHPIDQGFQLDLAETGTRENLVIEWSTDLTHWETVPNESMLEGSSNIPAGSSQSTIVGADPEKIRFYRIR